MSRSPRAAMIPRPSITAFFPCYNDAATIGSMVATADETLRGLTDQYEILVIDDASPDHSGAILDDLAPRYPALRRIVHERNRGYGGAIRSGFAQASNDLVFYTDGDAQYDPRELPALVAALRDDVDVVNGYKINRGDGPLRHLVGWVYNRFVRVAFGLRLRDVHCDFRLIRRRALQRIRLTSDSGAICVELTRALQDAGCRTVEVPVRHFARPSGSSQFFKAWRIARTLWDIALLWLRTSRRAPGATTE